MSVEIQKFEELQEEGKRLAAKGRLYESLNKLEQARKIKETPKVLQRIQKLQDFIAKHAKEDCSTENFPQNPVAKTCSPETNLPVSEKDSDVSPGGTLRILNHIQNTKVIHNENRKAVPTDPSHLSPEELERFKELKKSAIDLSYDGKFEEAREAFAEALTLCNCPKVKKFIQEIETIALQHGKKLQEFQMLSNTGTKLASARKPTESLKKLKDAFAVCPSPKVSKMITMLEKTPRPKTSSTDLDYLSPEQQAHFRSLYESAKADAREGRLQGALDALIKAKSICPTDRILKRIRELEAHLRNSVSEAEDDDNKMVAVADGFCVFQDIYEKLYPYQRVAVAWMWELFKNGKGGVLGDDMGLGKTFQVIAFLSGLIDADKIKHVLIIMPVSLLPNWEREFNKWCPGISVCIFHGGTKREKERNILRVQRRGHVLLTSYGMVLHSVDNLTKFEGEHFVWDYVILDEGHKIKNPTKTTKAVHDLPSKNRLVLTGTPIQNNLKELWSLYDFAHKGTLLGSLKTFKMQYENTITRAREKDATLGEKRLGTEMAENLKMLIKPYFLRRTKTEVWGNPDGEVGSLEQAMEQMKIANKLSTRKNDLIVWICMSDVQCDIYKNFLHSEAVKTILVSKRSPLVELTVLKKICDHPRLLSHRACLQLGLNGELEEEDLHRELSDESSYASSIENVTDETLIAESGKMKFLISLLHNLRQHGHRTLVFSLSRKILDMIHRILINRNWKVIRIDGTISKIDERERRIQLFQKDPSYSVFLLTTQVGGVGITLTAADRVIIYDPSWNPATDAQAVDRAYRIGQRKNVVVYRLITCGTVEEKIYRRQIFKDSITKQATCSSTDPYRYFSKQELRELFSLDNPNHSATQVQLSSLHANERQSDVSLDEHIAFLHSLNIFGISDHDLMFSKHIVDETEDNNEAAISHDHIKRQVAVAQQLISAEASVVEEGMRLAGTYSRPFTESIPSIKKNLVKDAYKPPLVTENQVFPSFGSAFNFNPTSSTPTPMRLILNKLHHSSVNGGQTETSENVYKSPPETEMIDLTNDYSPCAVKSEEQSLFRRPENVYKSPPETEMIDLTNGYSPCAMKSEEQSPFRRPESPSTYESLSMSRKSNKKYEPLDLEKNRTQAMEAGDASALATSSAKRHRFRRIIPSQDSEDAAENDTVFSSDSKGVNDCSPVSEHDGAIKNKELKIHFSEVLPSELSPKRVLWRTLNDSSFKEDGASIAPVHENAKLDGFGSSEMKRTSSTSSEWRKDAAEENDTVFSGDSKGVNARLSFGDCDGAIKNEKEELKVHSNEVLPSELSPKEVLWRTLTDSSLKEGRTSIASVLENGKLGRLGSSEMEITSSTSPKWKKASLLTYSPKGWKKVLKNAAEEIDTVFSSDSKGANDLSVCEHDGAINNEEELEVHSSEVLPSELSPKGILWRSLNASAFKGGRASIASIPDNAKQGGRGSSEMESTSSTTPEWTTASLPTDSPKECNLSGVSFAMDSHTEEAFTDFSLENNSSVTLRRMQVLGAGDRISLRNSPMMRRVSAGLLSTNSLPESETNVASADVNSPTERRASITLVDSKSPPGSKASTASVDVNSPLERRVSIASVDVNSSPESEANNPSVDVNTAPESEVGSDGEDAYWSPTQNEASGASVEMNNPPKKYFPFSINSPVHSNIDSPDEHLNLSTDQIKSSSPYKKIPYFEVDDIPVDVILLEDLSFDDKPLIVRNSRKSCAKPKRSICESDSSQHTSCPSSANSSQDEILVVSDVEGISDHEMDEEESISFVPSSIPNSPMPQASFKQSPRRITPLKLKKSCSSPRDSAFAKALASSPLIRPDHLPIEDETLIDSPVIFTQQKGRKNILSSDSENSEDEEHGSFSDSVEY